MVQTAKVIGLKDDLAEIEVSRKAMCDGCHQMHCGGKCAMSALMSSGSKMTAYAINNVDATIGDTVEISTSDKEVLTTAAAVFMLPLVIGLLLYMVSVFIGLSSRICVISAIVGFVAVFPVLRILDSKKKQRMPKISILRIISDDDIVLSDDE